MFKVPPYYMIETIEVVLNEEQLNLPEDQRFQILELKSNELFEYLGQAKTPDDFREMAEILQLDNIAQYNANQEIVNRFIPLAEFPEPMRPIIEAREVGGFSDPVMLPEQDRVMAVLLVDKIESQFMGYEGNEEIVRQNMVQVNINKYRDMVGEDLLDVSEYQFVYQSK